jgi:hypothetical protein
MKYLSLIALIIIFFSCKSNVDKAEKTDTLKDTIKSDTISTISQTNIERIKNEPFSNYQVKAVLIGQKIELFDENNKVIKDISNLNEKIVSVLAISNKINLHKNVSDCNEYKWVKIKIDNEIGFVDGTYLYELIEHKQNQKKQIGTDEIEIILTKNMGQREFDENDDPLYCFSDKPIIFKDKASKYEGLIKTLKNKFSENNKYYFEIADDDGAGDEIETIEKINEQYILTIKRFYQEGEGNLKVSIYKNNRGKFVAEIIEFERNYE